jgi:hypothetical protein
VALIAAAAALVMVVLSALPASGVAGLVTTAVCTVRTLSRCAATPTGTASTLPAAGQPGDQGDRRDQERQTRDDRRGRGEDAAPADPSVPGADGGDDPLGAPVPGTTVPEPQPRSWQPADEGAGEYDSSRAWPWDHGKRVGVEAFANALAATWPDASRNLSHYLANTGEPLEQDVDRILADVPGLRDQVDLLRTALGQDAVERARQSGATGPVTFPISTRWQPYYIGTDESPNWFYALGGISYGLTGQVTVHPPTTPGGPYRYQVSTQVNLMDQYNWDKGKSTQIGPVPVPVPDAELARMHLQGLAREYRNQGRSRTATTEGTVP